jgi:hypothetical protein
MTESDILIEIDEFTTVKCDAPLMSIPKTASEEDELT